MAPHARSSGGSQWRRDLVVPLGVGLVIRLLLLLPAVGQSFLGDEPGYWRLATLWVRDGEYTGEWPPLFPGLLALLQSWCGEGARETARLVMTALALWSGYWIAVLARVAHSERAGLAAAWTWALYLPLVPFGHVLISEGLALALLAPAWVLIVRGLQASRGVRARLALAGMLLGAACLTREAALLWLVSATASVAWILRGSGRATWVPALGLVMGAALVIAPWSVSTSLKQGSFQLLGRTAGVNAYLGWNAPYVNFDLTGIDVPEVRVPGAELRASMLSVPEGVEGWSYERGADPVAQNHQMTRRGLQFVADHPAFFLRTRVVKASDLATPLSIMARYLRLDPGRRLAPGVGPGKRGRAGGYGQPLAHSLVRGPLMWLTLGMVPLLVLAGAAAALSGVMKQGAAALVLAGFLATAPLALFVAMSRFRAPFEALLIVPAAVALSHPAEVVGGLRSAWRRSGGFALVCAGCGLLWLLALPCVVATVEALEAPEAERTRGRLTDVQVGRAPR